MRSEDRSVSADPHRFLVKTIKGAVTSPEMPMGQLKGQVCVMWQDTLRSTFRSGHFVNGALDRDEPKGEA